MADAAVKSRYTTDIDASVQTTPTPVFCEIDPDIFHQVKLLTNHYHVDHANNLSITISCLRNFHLVSGDLVRTCLPNGTWSGSDVICQVDYYKEKYRLSTFIILVSFLIPVIWLGFDFYVWAKQRAATRKIRFAPINDMRHIERLLGSSDPHQIQRQMMAYANRNHKLNVPSNTSFASGVDYQSNIMAETAIDQSAGEKKPKRKKSGTFRKGNLTSKIGTPKVFVTYDDYDVEEHFGSTHKTEKRRQSVKIPLAPTKSTSSKQLTPVRSASLGKYEEPDEEPIAVTKVYGPVKPSTPINQFAVLGRALWDRAT